jgi:hypothetical protein
VAWASNPGEMLLPDEEGMRDGSRSVSNRVAPNSPHLSYFRFATRRGNGIERSQRDPVRVRVDVFLTRYKISSNRPNDCTRMCWLGRSEADHDAQRRRTPERAAPSARERVRRMRRTHGHGCAGRPQRSRSGKRRGHERPSQTKEHRLSLRFERFRAAY